MDVRDHIARPKPNGYRSLHALVEVPVFLSGARRHPVTVEVQFRTIATWTSGPASSTRSTKYRSEVPAELTGGAARGRRDVVRPRRDDGAPPPGGARAQAPPEAVVSELQHGADARRRPVAALRRIGAQPPSANESTTVARPTARPSLEVRRHQRDPVGDPPRPGVRVEQPDPVGDLGGGDRGGRASRAAEPLPVDRDPGPAGGGPAAGRQPVELGAPGSSRSSPAHRTRARPTWGTRRRPRSAGPERRSAGSRPTQRARRGPRADLDVAVKARVTWGAVGRHGPSHLQERVEVLGPPRPAAPARRRASINRSGS